MVVGSIFFLLVLSFLRKGTGRTLAGLDDTGRDRLFIYLVKNASKQANCAQPRYYEGNIEQTYYEACRVEYQLLN